MSNTTQLIEALAMIEYWRTECEQQRTRAEAAEQELRAEKQRGNSAWDDGYAKSLDRAKAAEANLTAVLAKLAAIRAHLPALKRLHAWVSSDEMGKWTYLEGGTFYDDAQEMASIVADALEALEP